MSNAGEAPCRGCLRSGVKETCESTIARHYTGAWVGLINSGGLTKANALSCRIFRTPWQTIVSSTESLAQSHSILSQKIEVDVERPLREFQVKSKEMQAMSTMQGNMISMAREFDTAQKRADKARSGKSSAVKVANATADVDYSSQQWQSQAPYVFEQLQALDENRTNHLRDVLTQLQTHEVDLVERNRATAESCLNALLNVDTADEISTFVVRSTTGRPSVPPRIPSRSTTTNHLRPTTPGRSQDDNASEISGASAGMFRSSTSPGMLFLLDFGDAIFLNISSYRAKTVWIQTSRDSDGSAPPELEIVRTTTIA